MSYIKRQQESSRMRAGILTAGYAGMVGCFLTLSCATTPTEKGTDLRKPTEKDIAVLRYQLAESLVRKGSYDAASQLLADLVRKHPKDARLRLLLGVVLREKGVLNAARRELKRAAVLDPRNPEIHTALGALAMKEERYEEAETRHRQALKLAPRVARYHNDLGFCLMVRRKLDEARDVLEEAIRIDPSMRRAYNNLGFVLGLREDDQAALKAFQQAGSTAMALTNMGVVQQMRGRPARARRYFERALKHQKGYAPALRNLRLLDPGAEHPAASDHGEFPGETANSAPVPRGHPKRGQSIEEDGNDRKSRPVRESETVERQTAVEASTHRVRTAPADTH